METGFLNLISTPIRWAVYLIFAGEIASCTMDMRHNGIPQKRGTDL